MVLAAAVVLTGCPDSASDNNGNGNGDTPGAIMDTTAPDAVSNVTATPLPSGTEVLLRWTNSSSDDVATITISWSSTAAGIKGGSTPVELGAQQSTIGNLVSITPYTFVITVADAAGNSTATPAAPAPVNTLSDLIDADGNGLIDINSLERLHNMRYNLDVGAAGDDGRYKESAQIADEQGILCGANADTPCTGYELVRSLDFIDVASYDGSIANAMRSWRPNSMGSILPQAMADDGINSGWDPIGTSGNSATRFNSRFEGNGHTIHNLYGRLSTTGELGLFGAIGTSSVIRSIGVAAVRLYGSDNVDLIGALVGSSNGTIVASYASGTINGSAGGDTIGGLVGNLGLNTGTVVASYATVSINNNGAAQNRVGGLVGSAIQSSFITASYASGTVTGDTTFDFIGGLTGQGDGTLIITAVYASGIVNGSGGNDVVGGLIGHVAHIVASYATATAAGSAGSGNVGALGGLSVNATVSYGFGIVTGGTAGLDGTTRTGGVAGVGTGIVGARTLTLDNAGPEWNQAVITTEPATTITTMDAWDFGTAAEAPVLKYADYDGAAGTTYACGGTALTPAATIPDIVATPTGPMTITCGETHLPEQVR